MLATILVTIGRMRAQSARSARRIEACRVADDLLAELWRKPDEFPRSDTGTVPDHKGWRWRTHVVAGHQAEEIGAEVIAVEVFPSDQLGDPDPLPWARVEVALPVPRDEGDEQKKRPDTD